MQKSRIKLQSNIPVILANGIFPKHDKCLNIIKNAKNGNLYEPKSTKHLIYCEEELDWFPITLISTLFNLKLN